MNTFYQEVVGYIQTCYYGEIEIDSLLSKHPLLILDEKKAAFLLLKIPEQSFSIEQKAELNQTAEMYSDKGYRFIVIWEDRWRNQYIQVIARIAYIFGHFKRIHARKTKLVKLNKSELDIFMQENHLYGTASGKYKYGLLFEDKLVAAASFASMRKYYRGGIIYKSSELIRFANKNGCCVAGGLGKLLKHFICDKSPDDIMTYVDKDWSTGKSLKQLGFDVVGNTESRIFWLHTLTKERYTINKLPKEITDAFKKSQSEKLNNFLQQQGLIDVFDLGNIKYLKIIKTEPNKE